MSTGALEHRQQIGSEITEGDDQGIDREIDVRGSVSMDEARQSGLHRGSRVEHLNSRAILYARSVPILCTYLVLVVEIILIERDRPRGRRQGFLGM